MRIVSETHVEDPIEGMVRKPLTMYRISMGNGVERTFSSKRVAEAFSVQANTFLTDCWMELNELYTQAFCHYRGMYFYFDGRNEKAKNSARSVENNIIKYLQNVEFTFAQMARGRQCNLTPWRQLTAGAENVLKVCMAIVEFGATKLGPVQRRQVERTANLCVDLVRRMQQFGQDETMVLHPVTCVSLFLERYGKNW